MILCYLYDVPSRKYRNEQYNIENFGVLMCPLSILIFFFFFFLGPFGVPLGRLAHLIKNSPILPASLNQSPRFFKLNLSLAWAGLISSQRAEIAAKRSLMSSIINQIKMQNLRQPCPCTAAICAKYVLAPPPRARTCLNDSHLAEFSHRPVPFQ